jgi:hypothetical protein
VPCSRLYSLLFSEFGLWTTSTVQAWELHPGFNPSFSLASRTRFLHSSAAHSSYCFLLHWEEIGCAGQKQSAKQVMIRFERQSYLDMVSLLQLVKDQFGQLQACVILCGLKMALVGSAGQRQCCCASGETGPLSVFKAPGVNEAPAATMEVGALKAGEVAAHTDFRGSIYRFMVRPPLLGMCAW